MSSLSVVLGDVVSQVLLVRTKTPTDFDKYVTAAYYFTRTITVTNLLTPTITNKHNDDFELYVTIDRFYKANATLPTKTPTDFI